MANHASAKKAARSSAKRTLMNTERRSRIKTFVRKVELAIASNNKEEAKAALIAAQPEMMRGVTKGVAKLNAVARKISRLSARIKAMS